MTPNKQLIQCKYRSSSVCSLFLWQFVVLTIIRCSIKHEEVLFLSPIWRKCRKFRHWWFEAIRSFYSTGCCRFACFFDISAILWPTGECHQVLRLPRLGHFSWIATFKLLIPIPIISSSNEDMEGYDAKMFINVKRHGMTKDSLQCDNNAIIKKNQDSFSSFVPFEVKLAEKK